MSDGQLFVKEEIAEIPSVGLDLAPGGRRVRCFFKGPDQGVNAATGVLITLHGLGGRHNDISYKATRRLFSSKYNMVCVGVNYLGTDAFTRDAAYVNTVSRRLYDRAAEDPEIAAMLAGPHPGPERPVVNFTAEEWAVPESEFAGAECAKALADDYWDYGGVQALDVFAALAWLRRRLAGAGVAPDWRAVHLLSQSAGGQTAAMLLKLAPLAFATWLDAGGIVMAGGAGRTLGALLTDQLGWFRSGEHRHVGIEFPTGAVLMVPLRSPVGFADGPSRAARGGKVPDLADELALRRMDTPGHFAAGSVAADPAVGRLPAMRTVIRSLHGATDSMQSLAEKQALLQVFAAAGADAAVRPMTAKDVDGKVVKNDGHLFIGDLAALAERVGPQLWRARLAEPGPEIAGAGAVYRYPSPHGSWVMKHGDAPGLSFEEAK